MNHAQFVKKIAETLHKMDDYARNKAPKIAGKMAREFYKENFQKEGFVNDGLQKWQEVKRRKNLPEKPSEKIADVITTPAKKSADGKKPTEKPADAVRPILTGSSGALGRSVEFRTGDGEVLMFSNIPYAAAHNEGTTTAGCNHSVTIPQRKFMGDSKELDKLIYDEIERKLKEIARR